MILLLLLLLLLLFLLVSGSLVFYCSLFLGGQLLLGPLGRVSHGRLGGSLLVSFLYGHGGPLSQTLSSLVWHDSRLGDHSHDGIALAQSTIPRIHFTPRTRIFVRDIVVQPPSRHE